MKCKYNFSLKLWVFFILEFGLCLTKPYNLAHEASEDFPNFYKLYFGHIYSWCEMLTHTHTYTLFYIRDFTYVTFTSYWIEFLLDSQDAHSFYPDIPRFLRTLIFNKMEFNTTCIISNLSFNFIIKQNHNQSTVHN